MVDDGHTTTKEDLEALKKLGFEVKLDMREDKTGTLSLFGEDTELTYDSKNITIKEESAPYTFEDNKISMEQNGSKLVFEKEVDSNNNE